MKSPREPIRTETELYERALKLLMQKSRSRWELRRLLANRCDEDRWIEAVLDKCVARRYLDDVKYAVHLARYHAERKRQGRRRIILELKSRGIDPAIARQSVEEVFLSIDEKELLRQAVQKKLQQASGPWNPKKSKKLYDQLVRAGFNTDLIIRELRRLRMTISDEIEVSEEEIV